MDHEHHHSTKKVIHQDKKAACGLLRVLREPKKGFQVSCAFYVVFNVLLLGSMNVLLLCAGACLLKRLRAG